MQYEHAAICAQPLQITKFVRFVERQKYRHSNQYALDFWLLIINSYQFEYQTFHKSNEIV